MRIRPILLLLAVALFTGMPLIPPCAGAEGGGTGRPMTVRDLFRKMGETAAKESQIKLKLKGEISGGELGKMPKTMSIAVAYDKRENLVKVVNDSYFPDGMMKRTTVYSDKRSAIMWAERTKKNVPDEEQPAMEVRVLEPGATLPNLWTLPVKLAFPGLFTDALHGYEAFAREYSRSVRLNREPDEAGLVWFDLRPSATSGTAMRNEFNAGLKVKAGFAADGGWLRVLEVRYAKPKAVMKLRVVEQSLKLSEADLSAFEIPEKVMEVANKKQQKKAGGGKATEPLRELDRGKFDPIKPGKK